MGNYMTNKLEIMEVISSRIKNIFKYDDVSLWWIGRNNLLGVNTGLIKNDAKLAISYFIKKNIQNFVRKIYHLKIEFNLQNIFCDVVFYDGYLCRRPNYVLPDITCVQGEYEKRILLKYGYPKEKVVVTGQPRYDLLYYADKIYDKKQIFKQLELDPNKELIVWTTQTHGLSLEENKKNIDAIYSAVKALKNVQLVIKLHPGEDQRAALYKKDESFNPIIKGKEMDTYALLYVCDLMITKNSTTTMEAIALNKPVIVLNLGGNPDVVDYVEQGVALGVYKEEDLKSAIEKLLKDDTDLAKNRERYIEKYLYKIDGKATERVVKLVEEIIRKKDKQNVNL